MKSDIDGADSRETEGPTKCVVFPIIKPSVGVESTVASTLL